MGLLDTPRISSNYVVSFESSSLIHQGLIGDWFVFCNVGCLVVLGFNGALSDSISVYIAPSPREREKE